MIQKTDKIIQKLGQELKPVKPISCTVKRCVQTVICFIFCIAAAAALALVFGKNHIHAVTPLFMTQNIIIFVAGILSVLAAIRLSTPHIKIPQDIYWLTGIATCIWIGLLGYTFLGSSWENIQIDMTAIHSKSCLLDLLIFTIAPALFLFFFIKRAAPTHFKLTGYAGMLAAASFAIIGINFTCAISNLSHLFLWHFLPVIGLGLLGIFLGKKLLRW